MVKLVNPVFQNVTDMIGGLIKEKKKKKKKVTTAPSKTSVLKKITPLAPSKPVEIPISYYPRPRPPGRPRRNYDEDAPKAKRRTKAEMEEAVRQSQQLALERVARKKTATPIVEAFRRKQALKTEEEKLAKQERDKKVAAFRLKQAQKELAFPEFEFPESKVKAPKAPGTPREARRTHLEQDRDLEADIASGRILTKFQKQLLATRAGETGFLPFGTLAPLLDPSTFKGKSPKPSPKPSPKKAPAKAEAKTEELATAPAKAPAKRRVQQSTLDTIFGKKTSPKAEAPAQAEAKVGEGRFRRNKRIKKK